MCGVGSQAAGRGRAGWEGPRVRALGSTHSVADHRAGSLRCSPLLYAHRLQSKSGFGKGFYYFTTQLIIIFKNLRLCIQKKCLEGCSTTYLTEVISGG